ncbi:hypothetical protein ASPACDRAFT_39253 [Aspergillus aculeatus ATCC 16872]|uniref:RING-type domain-containing protein n=1 Tax=Aspergillus aculeatus (strain ATCC 16872 / CBS 172.66 / WB 5094) TaxID=690307 RepID=A0A1L9X5A9_ASPA1|nr:uncharacterized protein ASPACDRAFT_39253 [Aspergillus aculeatus ATCC 16872]OJK03635.1 hypothetical protein ASPACDRAFT_39253 [Aspergillus aculeatus ATCC 16872]
MSYTTHPTPLTCMVRCNANANAVDGFCGLCHESPAHGSPLKWHCTGCSVDFHTECFRRWMDHALRVSLVSTCPSCRSRWEMILTGPEARTATQFLSFGG